MILVGIVIGVAVMQLSILIISLVFNEKEEIVLPFSVFLFYPLVLLINKLVYLSRKEKRQRLLKKREKENSDE